MTDADKVMNPQHFVSDPADIRIRIRISPDIRIRITDHFLLTFLPWQSLRSLSAVVFQMSIDRIAVYC